MAALHKFLIVLVASAFVADVAAQMIQIPNNSWHALWVHKYAAWWMGGHLIFPIKTFAAWWNWRFQRFQHYYVTFLAWFPWHPHKQICSAYVFWPKKGHKIVRYSPKWCRPYFKKGYYN